MKILRIFRLVRVTRLLRRYGARNIVRSLVKDRAGSALLTLLLLGVVVLEFGSLLMLHLEKSVAGANITTASDALWYVIVTMSTVGYGDQYPISNAGRDVGTFIIVIGVGIFGTLTGYLANLFLAPRDAESQPPASPTSDNARQQVHDLAGLVEQQKVALARLAELIGED